MNTIIETKEVTIKFGGLVAVDSVNLVQKKGEVLSLIGPNGAGKTTLFNLLTGVYKCTSGNIFFHTKPSYLLLQQHEGQTRCLE